MAHLSVLNFIVMSAFQSRMQDPNADTEWNDILRSKGILPPKEEATIDEDTVVQVPILLFALFIFFQFTKISTHN